jgi:hypothetical protein
MHPKAEKMGNAIYEYEPIGENKMEKGVSVSVFSIETAFSLSKYKRLVRIFIIKNKSKYFANS